MKVKYKVYLVTEQLIRTDRSEPIEFTDGLGLELFETCDTEEQAYEYIARFSDDFSGNLTIMKVYCFNEKS